MERAILSIRGLDGSEKGEENSDLREKLSGISDFFILPYEKPGHFLNRDIYSPENVEKVVFERIEEIRRMGYSKIDLILNSGVSIPGAMAGINGKVNSILFISPSFDLDNTFYKFLRIRYPKITKFFSEKYLINLIKTHSDFFNKLLRKSKSEYIHSVDFENTLGCIDFTSAKLFQEIKDFKGKIKIIYNMNDKLISFKLIEFFNVLKNVEIVNVDSYDKVYYHGINTKNMGEELLNFYK